MKQYIRMKNRHIFGNFLIILCFVSMFYGCGQNKNSYEQNNVNETLQSKSYEVKNLFENYDFIPIALLENDWIMGNLVSLENDQKALGYIDIKTNVKGIVKQLDSTSITSSTYSIASSEDYFVFSEIDTSVDNTNHVFVYVLKTKELILLYSQKNDSFLAKIEGTIYQDLLYLNYPENGTYKTYCYDLKTGKTDLFCDNNSCAPVILENKAFYLSIDNAAASTTLFESDLDGKNAKEIIVDIENQEWIHHLRSNNKMLYLFVVNNDSQHQPVTTCIQYDVMNDVELDLFSKIGYMESPIVGENYISWWNPNDKEASRIHTRYSLFDMRKKIFVDYDDSVILLNKSKILWTRFNKEESEIEKGRIFSDNNSTLMYSSE